MTKYNMTDVRNVLTACGEEVAESVLKAAGVTKLSLLPRKDYSAVIESARAHAARTVTAHGSVDPFQRAGKANNDSAQQYWDARKAAEAAGEPTPDLPADSKSASEIQKLGRERADFERNFGNGGNGA